MNPHTLYLNITYSISALPNKSNFIFKEKLEKILYLNCFIIRDNLKFIDSVNDALDCFHYLSQVGSCILLLIGQ